MAYQEEHIRFDLFEIPTYKKISKDEMIALLKEYQDTKDPELKEKIVINNIMLVKYLCRKYIIVYMGEISAEEYEDYLQISLISLLNAIEKFDTTRDIQWSTFLGKIIKWDIKDKYEELNAKKRKNYKTCSIDEGIYGTDGLELKDILKDDTNIEEEVISKYSIKEAKEFIKKIEKKVKPEEWRAIENFYGLNGKKQKKQKEIAEMENTTDNAIRKRIHRGIARLRKIYGGNRNDEQ